MHIKTIDLKKVASLILFVSFFSVNSYGQDLIVTYDNDSISCKITKVSDENVFFTFQNEGQYMRTLLNLSEVLIYQYNYYSTNHVPKENIIGNTKYPHFRLAINGGASYLLAKISSDVPEDLHSYMKELKTGYHFSADFKYYFTEVLGVGVNYSYFNTKNSIDEIYVVDANGNLITGELSDNVSVNFIGPTFTTRFLSSNKPNAFLMGLSLGYMTYNNNAMLIDSYKLNGRTLGMVLDFSYDMGLSTTMMLGIQLSLTMGSLSSMDIYDGTTTQKINLREGSYESLSRIDLSIGLRFIK